MSNFVMFTGYYYGRTTADGVYKSKEPKEVKETVIVSVDKLTLLAAEDESEAEDKHRRYIIWVNHGLFIEHYRLDKDEFTDMSDYIINATLNTNL